MSQLTIIFDLDGTLVETAPDLTNAVNYLLAKEGLSAVPEDKFRLMIGQGAAKMIERGYRYHNIELDENQLQHRVEDFLSFYGDNIAKRSKPFPGILTQLDSLKERDQILAVCTNKSESLARLLLRDLDMDHYFSAILGGDSLDVKKPDPRHITTTVERARGRLDKAIMVGDSATDIRAANAAKIPVIAVTFGYSTPNFDGFPPDITIDHYDEFARAVQDLTAGRNRI